MNKSNFGIPFQKKYIIDAKWWRSWCDYTSFELSTRKRAKSPDQFLTSSENPFNYPIGLKKIDLFNDDPERL